jgi:hypothetical protein
MNCVLDEKLLKESSGLYTLLPSEALFASKFSVDSIINPFSNVLYAVGILSIFSEHLLLLFLL